MPTDRLILLFVLSQLALALLLLGCPGPGAADAAPAGPAARAAVQPAERIQ